VAGGLLPSSVTQALGLALYGMFLAIVLPPFRRCREIRFVVLIAVGMSCLMAWLPLLSGISGGFRIIVCAVVASALAAWRFPETDRDIAPGEPEECCMDSREVR